jgi:ribosomal protein S18 acetylase RimI-like enzyme
MIIRRIAPNDLSKIMPLCQEHAAYEKLPFIETEQIKRWDEAFFSLSPKLFGWVCDSDDSLKGYMTATVDFSTWNAQPFVYLDCLYLKPEVRRIGLGSALMRELMCFAKSRACSEIQWQTPTHNTSGIAFYDALGALQNPKTRFTLVLASEG